MIFENVSLEFSQTFCWYWLSGQYYSSLLLRITFLYLPLFYFEDWIYLYFNSFNSLIIQLWLSVCSFWYSTIIYLKKFLGWSERNFDIDFLSLTALDDWPVIRPFPYFDSQNSHVSNDESKNKVQSPTLFFFLRGSLRNSFLD